MDYPATTRLAFANPENTTLYFIAVNTSDQTVASSFYVPQGMKNAIEVMNERRSLTPKDGAFVDSFEPLETHVYVIRRE
jgi:hypothetical protein